MSLANLIPKYFVPIIKKFEEKDGYNDLLFEINRIVECKHDFSSNHFTVVFHKH
jgi:hypothetical protein